MIGYRQTYSPARVVLAQARPVVAPPPPPDFLFTGYTGGMGFVETAAVLTVSAAAGWVGIRTGLKKSENKYVRAAGWIGGAGVLLLAVLYLGAKTGVGQGVGLPAVRVSPT